MKRDDEEGVLSWADLLRVPDPTTHLTIFLQAIILFWRAENGQGVSVLPRGVSGVLLRPDHGLVGRARFHCYDVVGDERVGVWDETPFWVGFRTEKNHSFDHGDFRHPFQLFLRSFLQHTQDHASLGPLRALVSCFPVLGWKCSLCRCYNDWSVGFVEKAGGVVDLDTLSFLLTHENNAFQGSGNDLDGGMMELMEASLIRFFSNFEKICSQTSADPTGIIANLIRILNGYLEAFTTDRLHEFEQECVRDMKNYLYKEFKFLRTSSISLSYFPRDMMIARDLFPIIASSWADVPPNDTSPGLLVLLCHTLLEDRVLAYKPTTTPLLVRHGVSGTTVRNMTTDEVGVLAEYHPLLRHDVFVD